MTWNWQQKDWPHFSYRKASLEALEAKFLRQSGWFLGSARHIDDEDKNDLIIDMLSDEALKTSEIEGEYLNRDSVRSSLCHHFGLAAGRKKIPAAERGIADMMMDMYRGFAMPLTHENLHAWHGMLMDGGRDIKTIGAYRAHAEPMQVISGPIHKPKIHFEAPPSAVVPREMDRFIAWFNGTAPDGAAPLPVLTRAGMAHLYFVCIHPFEDGNGRIGRGVAAKVLSQGMGQPTLIALSHIIQNHKKLYYDMLERSNKGNEITDWLIYFAETILEAQTYAQSAIDFLVEKTKLYDKVKGQLNERQGKALARMFREGAEGFKGGLGAENYISITGTSRATTTRDLQELVELGILVRTGELKGTRYWLNMGRKG